MTNSLDGTVALVTGASSGIGEATAHLLAQHGAAVALVARRVDRLEELAAKLTASGASVLSIQADVTNRDEAFGAVERVVTELGRLDTVINNAGVMLLGPIEHAPLEEWERMVQVNLLGLLYSAKAALPHLLKAAEGEPRGVADLVNVSSVAGRVARLGSGVYNATKHAVGAFSESLRQEVTGRGDGAGFAQPAGDPRADLPALRQHPTNGGGRHRRCHRLHRVPAATRGNQRGLGSADRAAAVISNHGASTVSS